jgi:hypothetical protein
VTWNEGEAHGKWNLWDEFSLPLLFHKGPALDYNLLDVGRAATGVRGLTLAEHLAHGDLRTCTWQSVEA